MQLIAIIPFASIYLLYLICKAGNKGENRYGADPWAAPGDPVVAYVAPSNVVPNWLP